MSVTAEDLMATTLKEQIPYSILNEIELATI